MSTTILTFLSGLLLIAAKLNAEGQSLNTILEIDSPGSSRPINAKGTAKAANLSRAGVQSQQPDGPLADRKDPDLEHGRQLCQEEGNGDGAFPIIVKFLDQHPRSSWGWYLFASCSPLIRSPELDEQSKSFLKSHGASGPSDFVLGVLVTIGGEGLDAVQRLKYAAKAIQRFKSASDAGFNEPLVYAFLGRANCQAGDITGGLRLLRDAIRRDPSLPNAGDLVFACRLADIRAAAERIFSSRASKADLAAIRNAILRVHQKSSYPLMDVRFFATFQAFEGRKVVVAVVYSKDHGRILFISGLPHRAPIANWHLFDPKGEKIPQWRFIDRFKRKALIIERVTYTGPHHADSTMFVLTASGDVTSHGHEWQTLEPVVAEDLDGDGMPEFIDDHSDHYVQDFAAGIIDFSYEIYAWSPEKKQFELVPFYVLDGDSKAAQYCSAALVQFAAAEVRSAGDLMKKAAVLNPNDSGLAWNLRIINYHLKRYEIQYRQNPSVVTAAVMGFLPPSARRPNIPKSLPSQTVMRLFRSLLQNEHTEESFLRLKALLYDRNVTADEFTDLPGDFSTSLFAAEYTEATNKQAAVVHPEVRALENALLTLRVGRVIYTPFRFPPKVIDTDDPGLLIQMLEAGQPRGNNVPGFMLSRRPASMFDLISSQQIQSNAPLSNLGEGTIIGMLTEFLRNENFDEAAQLIKRAEDLKDPVLQPVIDFGRQIINFNYGRYYDVVTSLQNTQEDQDFPILNLLEAYERVGYFDPAEQAYLAAIATPVPNSDEDESSTLNDFVNLTNSALGHFGLARIAYQRQDLSGAKGHLLNALSVLNHLSHPYSEIAYTDTLTWMAKIETELGHDVQARAYNALAFYTSGRGTGGMGWIQSAFYYRYRQLIRIFLNDFQIERRTGNTRLAKAYLAASLSVISDLYRLTPQDVDRLGITDAAHEVYREGVRFHIDLNEHVDAFRMLNGVKHTTALQQIINQRANSNDQNWQTPDFSLATLSAGARQEKRWIVQYVVFSDRTGIFILSPDARLSYFTVPVGQEALRRAIGQTMDALLELGSDRPAQRGVAFDGLQRFYDLLVEPIWNVAPKGQELLIIPDGPLYQLPFAALRQASSGRYLIQDAAILYAGSVRDSAAIAQRRSPRKRLLVVHSPVTRLLKPLPNSAREAESVRQAFPGWNIVVMPGKEMDQQRFVDVARESSLIHVATHSVINATNPLLSAMILSEGDVKAEITMADLLSRRLRLDAAPIVFLSSCSSSNGKLYEEGVSGLAQGWFVAGASAVVASKWEVPDEQTADLVADFYPNFERSGDLAKSLQIAQINAIERHEPIRNWGAFAVFGHTR